VPRNQEVIRQWKVLHALESARHGAAIEALAKDLSVTTARSAATLPRCRRPASRSMTSVTTMESAMAP
jgi:hypothetical protein